MSIKENTFDLFATIGITLITFLLSFRAEIATLVGIADVGLFKWLFPIAGTLFILLIVKYLLILSKRTIEYIYTSRGDCYLVRNAREDDLDVVHNIARKEWGDATLDRDLRSAIIEKNPKTYNIVVKRIRRDSGSFDKIEGFFIIYPLTAAGINAIESGAFSGQSPDIRYILPVGKKCNAVYISGIWASGMAQKNVALGALIGTLQSYPYANIKKAYARAGSNRGLQLLKKYGFSDLEPLNNGSGLMHIHKLDIF